MYSGEQFKKDYLDYNFDEMLLDRNNPLITSNEKYLCWKNMYIKDTLDNYNKLNELLKNFSDDNYSITKMNNTTKYIYKYSNPSFVDSINLEIKTVLTSQRKLYKHFINFIEFLNSSSSG
jgi:hypothetical protein